MCNKTAHFGLTHVLAVNVRLDVHIRNQEVFDEFIRALTSDPEEDSAERASQVVETAYSTPTAAPQTLVQVESAIPTLPSRIAEGSCHDTLPSTTTTTQTDTDTDTDTHTQALMPNSPKPNAESGRSIDIDSPAAASPTSQSQRSDPSASESASAETPEPSLRFSMRVNRLELENLDETLALRALDAARRSEQNIAGLSIRSCAIGERFLSEALACIERDVISPQSANAALSASALLSSSPAHYPLRNLQALDLSTNWMNFVRDPNVGYMLHRVLVALSHYNGASATYRCSLKRLDLTGNYLRGFLPVIFGKCACRRSDSTASGSSASPDSEREPAAGSRVPQFCLPCALHLDHLRLSFCSLSTEDVEYLTGDGAGDLLSRVRQLDLSDNNLMMLPTRATTALFEGSLTHPSGRLAVLELRNVQLSDAQLAIAVEGMLKRALAREAALALLADSDSTNGSSSTSTSAASISGRGRGTTASATGSRVELEADLVEPSLMFLNLIENVFYSRTLALFLEALALHYPNLTVVRASYPRDLEAHADVDPVADGELADDPVIRQLRGKLNFLRKLERTVRQKNRHLSISFVE